VEIPEHLRQRAKGLGKRERLLIWWLTYRLPAARRVDGAAIEQCARETRLTASQVEMVRQDNPIHWERMRLKRKLRRAYARQHGSVPDGVTPGWPLGRSVDQIGVKLWRRKMHPASPGLRLKHLRAMMGAVV